MLYQIALYKSAWVLFLLFTPTWRLAMPDFGE